MPRLWITTPTDEASSYDWALNAPFRPDAGRQRIALGNPENIDIAREVAKAWEMAIVELFDETNAKWADVVRRIDLHSNARCETFWEQFWREATRCMPVLHSRDIKSGEQIMSWIAWGKETGAIRRLIHERAALPTKLPGEYSRMVRSGDVRFYLAGLLSELDNGCFDTVAEWAAVKSAFPIGQLVHRDIGKFLQAAECVQGITEIMIKDVFAAEIGPSLEVDFTAGELIGFLFDKPMVELSKNHMQEMQQILEWLKPIKMRARDGVYYPVSQLIASRPLADAIDNDEVRRAAFAPAAAVLASGYSDSALRLLVKARGALDAPAITLAQWAIAAPLDRLESVFRYLLDGDLGQELADRLKGSWLDPQRLTVAFRNLSEEDKSEIERKFYRGQRWPAVRDAEPAPEPEQETEQVMDGHEAFQLIADWWQREQVSHVSQYEMKTYPPAFPGMLPWPGDDAWDEPAQPSAQCRWLFLFVQAALVPLGMNKIGRNQSFSQFFVGKDWLDVFARASESSDALITALDRDLDRVVQNTEHHLPMRQFITFYAAGKNLENYLFALRQAERSPHPGAFRMVFNPRANLELTGSGVDAPPLGGMLGKGTSLLLRELYRLNVLTNPHGHPFAFTPIRKVRLLCTKLFGTNENATGNEIFDFLKDMGKELDLDPTFNCCFDLPFQILAEDGLLRHRVLNTQFEADARDEDEG